MRVETKPFGPMDVDERQTLRFPYGILGFEELKEYVLLDASQAPFYWLQSLDDPSVAFVLIRPEVFRPDYRPDVPMEDVESIGLVGMDDALVFCIVTIPEDQSMMTANLQGPLLVNRRSRIGRQSISTNPVWKVRHFILDEMAAVKERAC